MRPPPVVFSDGPGFEEPSPVRASESRGVRGFECDVCGKNFEGQPSGSGLYVWCRGDEIRYEEPPLCEECAAKVTLGALLAWETEDEEEG